MTITADNASPVEAIGPDGYTARETKWRNFAHPLKYWETEGDDSNRALAAIFNTVGDDGDQQLRHRHVMEQIRYYRAGSVKYGRKGAEGHLRSGDLLYVAESVFYGPMVYEPRTRLVTIQFPGESEYSEYMQRKDADHAATELAKSHGEFDGVAGVFRWNDGRVVEGTEALLEYLHGEPPTYAPTRFGEPIVVHGDELPWVEYAGAQGVEVKHLGYFNEFGPNVKVVRMEQGSSTPAGLSQSQQLRTVLSGELEYAGGTYGEHSSLYFPAGASYDESRASSATELLVVQLAPTGGQPMPFCEL